MVDNYYYCIIIITFIIVGTDGLAFEDIRLHWEEFGYDICKICNLVSVNRKIPATWKHAIIQRNPKKNFNINDLSTLRDISLLPTLFKVFSRCLCNRLKPFVTNEILFWQIAYLNKRDRQDMIYNLMTEIVDVKCMSMRMFVAFINFADAFDSVSHKSILESLEKFNIPKVYRDLIEDLY